MRSLLAGLMTAAFLAAPALADERPLPFAYPQPKDTSEFFALIEIPAGSMTKYEIDADTGFVFVDRYQSMPVVYPANYGSIPSSLAGDGDPLDVLVYTREPIVPGALIKVRAIGVLKMVDGGEMDDKIVAVPTTKIDPTFENIKSIEDMPAIERARLEAFFRVYKQLPAKSKVVELKGYESVDAANKDVTAAIESYRAKHP